MINPAWLVQLVGLRIVDKVALNGYTNWQIAQRLNYAEITIKKKVSALLRTHGMQSRAELATLASKCT